MCVWALITGCEVDPNEDRQESEQAIPVQLNPSPKIYFPFLLLHAQAISKKFRDLFIGQTEEFY